MFSSSLRMIASTVFLTVVFSLSFQTGPAKASSPDKDLEFQPEALAPAKASTLSAARSSSPGKGLESSPSIQEEELQLRIRRNFGYSSGSGSIQGSFTLTATGPEDLNRVVFNIDDQSIGEALEPPFQLRFNTGDYPLGAHTLHATGFSESAGELQSNEIRVEFVTADEGWQAALRFAIPILVIVLGAVLLTAVIPLVFTRGKLQSLPPGAARNYGAFGGAICPNCKRPFSLHFYGMNLPFRKFDRCPYCGKWGMQRRASLAELKAAEEAEFEADRGGTREMPRTPEESLGRELDDSRFTEL